MEGCVSDSLGHHSVLHVLVIGFHHQRGYQVEFSYPPLATEDKSLPEPWTALPCVAMPDGAHNYEEDISIFHLPSLKEDLSFGGETVFGVSCYRQIESKDLKVKDEDVTRRTVQKSVCVLLQMPLYGFVLSKLALVTQAYFNERDFTKTKILEDFYNSLNHSLETARFNDTIFNVGLTPKPLISKLKHKVLMVLKLLLLERKILFWGGPVNDVCMPVLTVLSLLPGVIQKGLARCVHSSQNSEKLSQSPRDQYGMPLDIFGNGSILHPYLSLQQMDVITDQNVHGYFVGACNILFKEQTHAGWDAMMDLETGTLHIAASDLDKLVALSTEDLRFCDFILGAISEKDTNENDTGWEGSDEWIRSQFKIYLLCLLATAENDNDGQDGESYAFNSQFINAWKLTNNFKIWIQTEHPGLDGIVKQHPFAGETTVTDVRIRLQSMLESIASNSGSGKRIEEAVIRTGQIVGGAWSSAKSTFSSWKGWFSGMVQDIDVEVEQNAERIRQAETQNGEASVIKEEDLNSGMTISISERLGEDTSTLSQDDNRNNHAAVQEMGS